MSLESARLCKLCFTYFKAVRFLPSMDAGMCLEITVSVSQNKKMVSPKYGSLKTASLCKLFVTFY